MAKFKLLTSILLTSVLALNTSIALAQGKDKAVQSNEISENAIINSALYHTTNLVFADSINAQKSLDWIIQNNDKTLAPHLITAMRYSSLGRGTISKALNTLTGEVGNKDWFEWMQWQQRNKDLKTHESYLDFKSTVLYSIDPAFSRFFRPDMEFDIKPEEIVWGGVRVDGIPALDNPKHINADQASYLKDDDEVFGVEINGETRAYPLRIMGWHEMFNDVIGGVPVSLAYCTLCGAGILFEGDNQERQKFGVSEPFTFGSSGFLYQSNKLMYDRNTDSLWNQFTGEPVGGDLRGSGISLKIRPVVITSWSEWKKQNPKTKVLSLDTGFTRNYGSGVVYQDYFASPDLMFPAAGDQSNRLKEKEQVFGMRLEGGIKAWPLDTFKNGTVINDIVGKTPVVLIGDKETRTVRAYERKNYEFNKNLITKNGEKWSLEESYLLNPDGSKLKRLPGHVSYWFAWAGYLGDETALYKNTK